MTAVVPLHPEPTGRISELRWRVPAGLLPFTGPVAGVRGALGQLLLDGTVETLLVEPAAVVTVLGPGHGWRGDGARVRSALQAALAEPAGWRPGPGCTPLTSDQALLWAAEEVVRGRLGDFVRSHGGSLTVLGADGGVVEVAMAGACDGCRTAGFTLHSRFEQELRRRCPWLDGVRAVPAAGRAQDSDSPREARAWA